MSETYAGALGPGERARLEQALPEYLRQRRWFPGKSRAIVQVTLREALPLLDDRAPPWLCLAAVRYAAGAPETYLLPVSYAGPERLAELEREAPGALLLRGCGPQGLGALYDGIYDQRCCQALLELIREDRGIEGDSGWVSGTPAVRFEQLLGPDERPQAVLLSAEQSNSSLRYGRRLILKLYRRLGEGMNPDLEIGRFLEGHSSFAHTAPLAGSLELVRPGTPPVTLALLQGYVENQGDAWSYTLASLADFYRALDPVPPDAETPRPDVATAASLAAGYLRSAELLGRRTAELHLALAGAGDDPAFAREPFSEVYAEQSAAALLDQAQATFAALGAQVTPGKSTLPAESLPELRRLLERKQAVLDRCLAAPGGFAGQRIRTHGDYHLGQVLYTGDDFVIIDFEGEPARSLEQRRIKHSPLRDLAGMLRSFHYAAYAGLFAAAESAGERRAALEPWARLWYGLVAERFLDAYLSLPGVAPLLPASPEQRQALLGLHLLEKALYELQYELNNRPGWVAIPLQGIMELLGMEL